MSDKVEEVDADMGPPQKVVKMLKKYRDSLVDDLNGLDEESLKKKVLTAERNVLDTNKALEADENLKSLKEQIKIDTSTYKDVINGEQAIAQYCIYLMKSRGYNI